MSTMDTFVERANDAAQCAARAAKYVALISRKRLDILAEQDKIRRNYARLGKVYYKDYVTDEEPDEAEYQPLCEAISGSFRHINELRQQIEAARAAYRGEVGQEPPEEEPEAPEEPEEEPEIQPEPAEESTPEEGE